MSTKNAPAPAAAGAAKKEKKEEPSPIVPVELGLSPDVVERLPRSVRDWKTSDTQLWLQDIFDGSGLLADYLKGFERIGVRGIDLLAAKDGEIKEFGITTSVHVARIKACIAELIAYQRYIEAERITDKNMRKIDQGFYDLEKAYREKCADGTIYVPTAKVDRWSEVDVFAFLSNPQHNNQLTAFLKPIANKKLNGKELLELATLIPEKDLDATQVIAKMDMQITADARDLARLRTAVFAEQTKLNDFHRRLRSEAIENMRRVVPKLDPSKLDPQTRSGSKGIDAQGSFGEIYFGKYEKRTVAIKQLKSRDGDSKGDNGVVRADANAKALQKGDIEAKLNGPMFNNIGGNEKNRATNKSNELRMDELSYEAFMLAQCSGPGVVQIIGFDDSTSPNRLVTEFMASLSIFDEMKKADINDDRSIFHPNHERNRVELANGIMNPVFYQIVRIARDISSALARIHSLGIVHLDIAARNILLNARKQPKIADFGLAVFEKDMKLQHEFYKDRTKHIHSSSVKDQERRILIDMTMTEDVDEVAIRNYKTQMEKRPVAWSPSWVIQENPLLDQHADIYAYGCFLFEMLTHKAPHEDVPKQEIIARKMRGDGNASIPIGDERFTDVIRDCWKAYDDQPMMSSVSERLHWLHQEMGIEGHRFQAAKAAASNSTAFVPPPPPQPTKIVKEKPVASSPYARGLGVDGPTSNPYSSGFGFKNAGQTAPAAPAPAPPVVSLVMPPATASDAFIRLQLLEYIEFDVNFPGLFSDQGILRTVLFSWLRQEHLKRNHDFIGAYMQCIRVENDANQMDAVAVCLEYLENLAENEHGDLHDTDAWLDMCVIIVRVLAIVLRIQIEDRHVNISSLTSVPVTKENASPVVFSAFAAIAALSRYREFFADDRAEVHTFMRNLATMVQHCLNHFDSDAGIVEMIAATVHHTLILSPIARDFYEMRGVVQLLLKQIKLHDCVAKTVINLVNAVGYFPVSMLLRNKQQPSNEESFEVTAADISAVAAVEWCDVLVTLFHVITTQLEALNNNIGKLRNSMGRHNPDEDGEEDMHAMVEKVISSCLDVLLRACEDTNISPSADAIEKFLYVANTEMIETLVQLCRDYPRSFFIQKGAIGLLAYIVDTGREQLSIERDQVKQSSTKSQNRRALMNNASPIVTTKTVLHPVLLKLAVQQRLDVLLRLDPKMQFVLTAMETFKRDGNISMEFKNSTYDHVNGVDSSSRHTRMLSETSSISRTAGQTQGTMGLTFGERSMQQPSLSFNTVDGDVEMSLPQILQFNDVTLEFDENGEHITAASLQRYGSMILGIAARGNPPIQAALLRSNFNELIFGAFQHFPGDIGLIRSGCIALSSVCRKDAKHQRLLHQLQVSKHLITSCLFHAQIWQVLDGVTCALVGLLEPPDLFQQVQDNSNNATNAVAAASSPVQMEKFDGYRLTEQLSKMKLFGMPIIEFFAMKVCLLQCAASHPLVANFLKLVACMVFWKPALIGKWEEDFVTSLDAWFILTFGKRLKIKLQNALRSYITEEANSGGTIDAEGIVSTVGGVEQQEREHFAEYVKQYGFKLPLSQYVRTAVRVHAMHSHVVAIGMGLRIGYIRTLLPKDFKIGDDLGQIKSAVVTAALFGNGQGSIVDSVNGWDDNIYYCLEAIARPVKNPIYLRYTMWLLLLLISKTPDNSMMTEGEVTTDMSRSPEAISSQVAIKGGIEWAIEVMRTFPQHYSLQCLSTIFLIWMEVHGRLYNRSSQRLQQLHLLLVSNRNRYNMEEFLTMDQEGQDPILMCADRQKTFGVLAMHADRLLRLVEQHILPAEGIKYDRGQPGSSDVSLPNSKAHASAATGEMDSGFVSQYQQNQAALENIPVPGGLWDGVCRPLSIAVISIESQEDPNTQEANSFYVFKVIWDDNLEWTVSKRFRAVFDFSAHLQVAFNVLPPFARREFTRSKRLFEPRTPVFLDNRRAKLHQWVDDAMKVNAVRFFHPFLEFFEVPQQLRLVKGPCPPIRSVRNDFCVETPGMLPVQCMEFDVVDNLLFVGCGKIIKGISSWFAGKSMKGAIAIYKVDTSDGLRAQLLASESFEEPVTSIAWDAVKHCVFVGLGMGVVMHYHWNVNEGSQQRRLNYGGEVDGHRSMIVGLQSRFFSTTEMTKPSHLCAAASAAGACHVYNMLDGMMLSQTMTMARQTLVSSAYDIMSPLYFLGNEMAEILVMDPTKNPPVLISTVSIPLPQRANPQDAQATGRRPRPVCCLQFVDETRLLYCTVLNEVHVYIVPRASGQLTPFQCLRLQEDAEITSLDVIDTGRLVVVVDDKGRVVVFSAPIRTPKSATTASSSSSSSASAAASEPSSPSPTMLASAPSSATSPDDLLATSASRLSEWSDVVVRSNTVMRDWLRAKGVDSSKASTRLELMQCIQRALRFEVNVVGSLAVLELCKSVETPLFVWKLASPSPANGQDRPAPSFPYANAVKYASGDVRSLFFGTSDGFLHAYSMQQFVSPHFDLERDVLQSLRQTRHHQPATTVEGVLGSTKTARGKRSIIVQA